MNTIAVIILAAGKGTRMKSDLAKVLHPLCGRPLIGHVVAQALRLEPERVAVVVGHQANWVKAAVKDLFPKAAIRYATQSRQLGTGHAVLAAKKALAGYQGPVLILSGDVPLLSAETMRDIVATHAERKADLTLVTFTPHDASGYGRVVTAAGGRLVRVVEEKDATDKQKEIGVVSAGIFCVDAALLFETLAQVGNSNAQGEYYLPDIIPLMIKAKRRCVTYAARDEAEVAGVNDRAHLAELSSMVRAELLDALMRSGVTVEDPSTTAVELGVSIGPDTTLESGVDIRSGTVIGRGCVIGKGSRLEGARVADLVRVLPYSVVTHARLDSGAVVGPFAVVEGKSRVGHGARVGSFVSLNGTDLGAGAQVMHLSYLADADVGAETRIGAGVLTCHLGSVQRAKTIVGQGAFVGSDTVLVSPVEIGNYAHVASASTIMRDVPDNAMYSARAEPEVREDLGSRYRRIADAHAEPVESAPTMPTTDVSAALPRKAAPKRSRKN